MLPPRAAQDFRVGRQPPGSAVPGTRLATADGMPIICATDFSPSAQAATEMAAGLARRLDQPIVLFHAVQPPYVGAIEAAVVHFDWTQVLERAAAARLEGAARTLRESGLVVSTELSFGAPAPQIVELAQARAAEAIVVGTHGRSGLPRLFLGSVAEKVLREAGRPVFVVHAEAGRSIGQRDQRWRIAVLLDGGPTDRAALAWTARLADRTQCETVLVRLISPEVDAARFGLEEPWGGCEATGPLIEAAGQSLTRELLAVPALARAPRRFVIGGEQAVTQACADIAALGPTFVVLAGPSGKFRRAARAVRPTWLLRALTVPAVCVPIAEPEAEHEIPNIGSVLVAVDVNEPEPGAVLRAYGLLRPSGGRVELCYVHERGWDGVAGAAFVPPLTPVEKSACEMQLRALIPAQAEALGIVTNVSVIEGPVAGLVIAQAAARLGTDVVAIATHDRRGLARALRGSVAEAVLHESAVPALIVHA
jgi:nucleotide-binding universal stress UspA family protein